MSKAEIKQLIGERDKIDSQLTELHDTLKSLGVDMNTQLVDQEGFPVADLDIVQIRKARHSIICLSNDRKSLTDKIEGLLIELHEASRQQAGEHMDTADQAQTAHRTSNKPFLEVENVIYGSPAFYGGLVTEDIVIQCGPLHADNFKGIQNLSEVIAEHVGKTIQLTVLRGTTVHRINVNPGKWEGAGVFGARFNVIHPEK
ncbi:Nas2-N domain-containing protein [Aphelenchoides bicaudatus]|nr:Nas2-N domain-containing protein [Aphelenchoides bicaudatus]